MNIDKIKIIDFCNIPLVNTTRKNFANFLFQKILGAKLDKPLMVFSLNGEGLSLFYKNKKFKDLLLKANYIHADGMSIVKASNLVSGESLIERIATTDWFHDFAQVSEYSDVTHYFLGGKEENLKLAIKRVMKLYPGLRIVGWHHGYFNDLQDVIVEIKNCNPSVVWVGMGRPKQEQIALQLQNLTQVSLIKTCGGLFDFLSGINKRAPLWMQSLGLEWFYRLWHEPRRLFKRYLYSNTHSLLIMLIFFVKRCRLSFYKIAQKK